MSYSRWSNSVWYTYHAGPSASTQHTNKEDQIFEICTIESFIRFTYRDIVYHMEKGDMLQFVKEEVIFSLSTSPSCIFSIPIKTDNKGSSHETVEYPPLTVEEAKNCYTDEEYLELIGYMTQFVEDVNSDFDDKTS